MTKERCVGGCRNLAMAPWAGTKTDPDQPRRAGRSLLGPSNRRLALWGSKGFGGLGSGRRRGGWSFRAMSREQAEIESSSLCVGPVVAWVRPLACVTDDLSVSGPTVGGVRSHS